jgi:hypothetical protein
MRPPVGTAPASTKRLWTGRVVAALQSGRDGSGLLRGLCRQASARAQPIASTRGSASPTGTAAAGLPRLGVQLADPIQCPL